MKRTLWILLIPLSLAAIPFITNIQEMELSAPVQSAEPNLTRNEKNTSPSRTQMQRSYSNDLFDGTESSTKVEGEIITQYYENRNIKSVEVITDDLLNGTCRYYNINGILVSQGEMVNNRKEGLWKYYSDNGILISTINYQSGKQIASLFN